jgi:hypothetical protein
MDVWSMHSRTAKSALNLAAARLPYIAGTAWLTKKYLNIDLLKEAIVSRKVCIGVLPKHQRP